MRRLTAWIGGIVGGILAYRFWRRHSQAAPEPPVEPTRAEADDRADELRAKLAETRAADPEPEAEGEEPSPEPAAADEESESPESRRQRVHEEGRATLDEMKSDESP
jgi:hypothetical protein